MLIVVMIVRVDKKYLDLPPPQRIQTHNTHRHNYPPKTISSSVLLSSFRLALCDRWDIITMIENQGKRAYVIRVAYFFIFFDCVPAIKWILSQNNIPQGPTILNVVYLLIRKFVYYLNSPKISCNINTLPFQCQRESLMRTFISCNIDIIFIKICRPRIINTYPLHPHVRHKATRILNVLV